MPFATPILLLIFNRPEVAEQVFRAIRRRKPAKLYVAADGPRVGRISEQDACAQARKVTERVDWECEVKRLYREVNLGCGRAVSGALNWFFESESEGIILEDDCLPSNSFFSFCELMLDRYREDQRIGTVSGNFFFPPVLRHPQPYVFSKYAQIWGWATWRRVWQTYDFHLHGTEEEWEQIIRRESPTDLEGRYWLEVYRALRRGIIDTWDYQVMFSCWKHRLAHVAPTRNLVSNLGYGAEATHTNFESPLGALPTDEFTGELPAAPFQLDPWLDSGTFFFRYLESLHNTWILHQAIDVTEKLAWARWNAAESKKKVAERPAETAETS